MPSDDAGSLAQLLPQGVSAVVAVQQELDVPATDDELNSGTRFYLTSIPSAELRVEFGLSVSESRGFLIRRRTTSALKHRVSLTMHAVPEPIDPAPLGGWAASPFTLFEPAFMVNPEREIELGERICDALRDHTCTVRLPEPDRLDAKTIRKAGEKLRGQLVLADRPELGVVAFRVSERPPVDLVVIVTEKAKKDGVFLVREGAAPTIYSIPDDDNDGMFYEPLHLLTMAIGEWLAGDRQRRRMAVDQLPQEWGFTTLELFAENLVSGYQQCVGLLSEPRSSGPLTQQFDLARVQAEVAFRMRQRQGGAPVMSIIEDLDEPQDLVSGRVRLELERLSNAIGVTLTLVAPGFVLSSLARAAFVKRAQGIAEKIADEFRHDHSVDYLLAIRQPHNAAQIVVLLSIEKPGDPFKYLVTWPVRTAEGERHFVFQCREDKSSLDDIKAIVRASDRLDAVSLLSTLGASQIDDDVYEAYNWFFRAARVWRSGVARDLQSSLLGDDNDH
jgi:hypothetical protein